MDLETEEFLYYNINWKSINSNGCYHNNPTFIET